MAVAGKSKGRGQWELKIEYRRDPFSHKKVLRFSNIQFLDIQSVIPDPLFDLYDHHRHVVGLGGATGEGPDGVADMVKDMFSGGIPVAA